MPRCPDCNKFVSIEMAEPEWTSTPEAEGGNISGEVRLVQTCAECGTELAEANLPVEAEHELKHEDGCKLAKDDNAELEVDYEAVNNDRMEGKGRGAKHFYSADISLVVTCPECKATVTVDTNVEEQSSCFESLT